MREQYTPTTEMVKVHYAIGRGGLSDDEEDVRADAFDRWLDQVRREAKVEALKEAAEELLNLDDDGNAVYWDGDNYVVVNEWLKDRADQLEQEGKNNE